MKTNTNTGKGRGVSGLLSTAAIALLSVVAQSSVAATTKSLEFTQFEYGSVDVKIGAIPTALVSHANIGAYNTKIGTSTNGGISYSYGATFESFCIDVWQSLSFNANPDYTLKQGYTPTPSNPYYSGTKYTERLSMLGYSPKTTVDPISTQVIQNLSRLYDEAHSGGHLVNSGPFSSNNPNTAFNSPVGSAALQLAIWEIVYDTDNYNDFTPHQYNLATGDFYSLGNTGNACWRRRKFGHGWCRYLVTEFGVGGVWIIKRNRGLSAPGEG